MNATIYINFATAALTFVFGILILSGVIYPGNSDSTKLTFGLVLIIYGIYRFINSVSKMKQIRLQERSEKLNKEKEKLFDKL